MPELLLPKGVLTPLITPFFKDAVDAARLRELIERQIAAGINGIIVCDQTGEGLTLNEHERSIMLSAAIDAAGEDIPVVAAVGTNCTSRTIDIAAAAPEGVAALLVTVPYYSRPTARGIIHHFAQIAETTKLPVIIDDDPDRTARALTWEILEELRSVENIRGVRHCGPDITSFVTMPPALKRRFRHYAGNDRTALACLMTGASSMSSPVANLFPELVWSFHDQTRAHAAVASRTLHARLCSAIKALGDVEPSNLKYALSVLVGGSAEVRLPLVATDKDMAVGIDSFVARYLTCTRHQSKAPASQAAKFL
jgi:4-hydroxy-tetrahydrodipicolinate synthase